MPQFIALECKYGSGIYADEFFVKDGKVIAPLKFRNGRAVVSEARLKELEQHPKYGIEFGKVGTITDAYTMRLTRVTRSEGKYADADDTKRIEQNEEQFESPRQRAAKLEAELKTKAK